MVLVMNLNGIEIKFMSILRVGGDRLSLVDPNHNAKDLRYQVIGGSYTCVIGNCIVDI